MAQQGDNTFLYRLKIALDDAQAMAQFAGRMGQAGEMAEGMAKGIRQSEKVLEDVVGTSQDMLSQFARAPQQVGALQRAIIQSDAALEDLVNTNFGTIRAGAKNSTKNLAAFRQEAIQASEATETMNKAQRRSSRTMRKTSRTSQSMLRIMQDSRFGMMGMANNIQALSESLVDARARGVGMTQQLKAGFKSLITGPFAVPALVTAITVILQIDWDKVPEKVAEWREAFIEWASSITDAEDQLRDIQDIVDKTLKVEDEDVKSLFVELSELSGEAEDKLSQLNEEVASMRMAREAKAVEEFQKALDNLNTEVARERLRALSEPGEIASTDPQEGLIGPLEKLTEKQRQAAITLRRIRAQSDKFSESLLLMGKASQRENKLIDLMNEKWGFTREHARRYLNLRKETNEESEDELEALQKLSVEYFNIAKRRRDIFGPAGEEGSFLRIAKETGAEFDERIREVEEEFDEKVTTLMENLQERREQIQERFSGDEEDSRLQQVERLANAKIEELERQRDIIIQMLNAEREEQLSSALNKAIKEQQELIEAPLSEGQKALIENAENGILDPVTGRMMTPEQFQNVSDRRLDETMQMIELKRQQLQQRIESQGPRGAATGIGRIFGLGSGTGFGAEQERQLGIVDEQMSLALDRFDARIERIRAKRLNPQRELTDKELKLWRNREKKKAEIEERWAKRRENLRAEMHEQRIQGSLELTNQLVSDAESAATGFFETWMSSRKRELEDTRKTEAEKREILKKEGKKRFKIMKAIKIASASVSGLSAAVEAWEAGMKTQSFLGPGAYAVAASMAAASLAATSAKINQIASLSIGDKLGKGSGGGGGPSGQFTQLNASASARRASEFGTNQRRSRRQQERSQVEKTAKAVGKEVAKNMPSEVTMDDGTAEQATKTGLARSNRLDK